MAKYEVYVFCNECGVPHPTKIILSLDDGPVEKESINNAYAGEELPPAIANLQGNYFKCPDTGKMFMQKDNDQVYLVAIADDN